MLGIETKDPKAQGPYLSGIDLKDNSDSSFFGVVAKVSKSPLPESNPISGSRKVLSGIPQNSSLWQAAGETGPTDRRQARRDLISYRMSSDS